MGQREHGVVVAETERLVVRQFTLHDLPQLAVYLADHEVMRHSVRGVHSVDETRQFIEWCIGHYESHGFGPWALIEKSSSVLVGFCGLSEECIEGESVFQVGYRIGRSLWGRGLATEALCQVVTLAFERYKIRSVVAIVDPSHIASLRVVEKAGFRSFVCKTFAGRSVHMYWQDGAD